MTFLINKRWLAPLGAGIFALSLQGASNLAGAVVTTDAAPQAPAMAIGNYQLQSSTRIGRTVFEYEYKADVTNNTTFPYENVGATLTSNTDATTVVEGSLSCGTLWGAGTGKNTATCSNTFKIRQDRSSTLDWSKLTWSMTKTELPDEDGDGVPDTDDNCPQVSNPNQDNEDGNSTGDACEVVISDQDEDTIPDEIDNCPAVANVDQSDGDDDGLGDACDDCLDVDHDSICDSKDLCPNDPNNACTVTIKGEVYGGGSALAGATVKIGDQLPVTTTQEIPVGRFTFEDVGAAFLSNDGVNAFFPVKVAATGYSTGYAKVVVESGKTEYDVTVQLQPVSATFTADAGIAGGASVAIVDSGDPVGQLTIPAEALPDGVTEVIGTVTYLDPATDDLQSAPGGDLLAARADPNDPLVTLESYGMMEFDLRDQDGNPIHELDEAAEVCMKAEGLAAEATIPLWWYDETTGLWQEEGHGTVRDVNGTLMICGNVTHFTWWNYDQPIESHACFKFDFRDEDSGARLSGTLEWYADGATYSGSSPARACNTDGDDPSPPAPGKIDSFTVKRSASGSTEYIRVYTYVGGQTYYLVRDGDGTYSLTQNRDDATEFAVPQANASCLNNTNVDQCVFLDYADTNPDGILPLSSDIDYPPVISDFTVDQTNLTTGSTTPVSVTVTDPEGSQVDVAWSQQCGWWGQPNTGGSISPASASGDSASVFQATFTAPASLSSLYEWCQITVTATDQTGHRATAEKNLIVTSADGFVVEGTLYGTDGQPMPGTEVTYYNWSCNPTRSVSTWTDANGHYRLALNISDCFEGREGGWLGDYMYIDYGSLNVPYFHENAWWYRQEDVGSSSFPQPAFAGTTSISIGDTTASGCLTQADDGSISCVQDIHLPTVWGPLSGHVYLPQEYSGWTAIMHYPAWSYYSAMDYSWLWLTGTKATYGPILAPVGYSLELAVYGTMYDSSLNPLDSRYFPMASTEGTVQDIGIRNITAPVTVTVFDGDGNLLADASVELTSYGNYYINGVYDPWSETQITDANGEVTFGSVPAGELYATAHLGNGDYVGFGMGDVAIKGQAVFIDINPQYETCAVSGTAYDRAGQPLANATLRAYASSAYNWGERETTTGSEGQFFLEGIPPGEFSFIFSAMVDASSDRYRIDNCRPPASGAMYRTIRIDLPYAELYQQWMMPTSFDQQLMIE